MSPSSITTSFPSFSLSRSAAAAALALSAALSAAPASAADNAAPAGGLDLVAQAQSPSPSPSSQGGGSAGPGGGIYAGDWLVRLRAISIMPNVETKGVLSTLNTGVSNTIVPEVDFTYMVRDAIGVELILGTSRNQVTTSALGRLGGVGVLPPTLLLQYHFNHAGRVRPYLGAGMNYTLFYNNGLTVGGKPVSISNHSFGPALQAGVDVQIAKNVFLNADIKKIWMRTEASQGGTSLGTLYIDPVIVGIGVGMKF